MQFLNTVLFQHLITWDLRATERKQFGSPHLSTASQQKVRETPASEPPKVFAGLQGPIPDLLPRNLRAQEYECGFPCDYCTGLCLPSSPTIESLREEPLSLGAEPVYSFLMSAISLLLCPSDSAQLPSVNSPAEPCT